MAEGNVAVHILPRLCHVVGPFLGRFKSFRRVGAGNDGDPHIAEGVMNPVLCGGQGVFIGHNQAGLQPLVARKGGQGHGRIGPDGAAFDGECVALTTFAVKGGAEGMPSQGFHGVFFLG